MRVVPGLMLVGLLTIVIAGGLALTLDSGRAPNMPQLVEVAGRDMPLSAAVASTSEIDGVGFPDWSRWGWHIAGGRTDVFGQRFKADRKTGTAVYRKGKQRIAYTVVEGTENVDDEEPTREVQRTPPEGETVLTLGGATVKRKVRGRTVVLSGSPVSARLFDEMQDMALRTSR